MRTSLKDCQLSVMGQRICWSRSAGRHALVWSKRCQTNCQMQLCCFVAHLEPTRVRWETGQVSLTSLKTREACVQECNGVESVNN